MKRDKDDWLDQKITEELLAMADEREKELMEMEELQGIEMPIEKFADIKKEALRRRREFRRKRLRPRIAVASAAVLVLMLGVGAVGNRVYEPRIIEREQGSETTTKINNTEDAVASAYDEEEVCQEIEEKLGVIAPRLGYEPQGMQLSEYWVDLVTGEAVIIYGEIGNELKIYISKDNIDTNINFEMDDIKREIQSVMMGVSGMEVPIYECADHEGNKYYQGEFKLLNTYYSIVGMMKLDEYVKILENVSINNA